MGDYSSAKVLVDAGRPAGAMRALQGVAGIPGPARGAEHIPNVTGVWEAAHVKLVRTYDWVSRLDTLDNPDGLFPDWSADPDNPNSYNFDATDSWVRQVQAIGADILFTIASAVPSNKRPARNLVVYEQVVEKIVRHFVEGWGGGGFSNAITRWEFGDQPDFGTLHFDGTPNEFYEMYAAAARAVKRVSPHLQFGGPCPAFALNEGPYRQGFLDFVKRTGQPLDFFTWMWFTDDSRDPLEFRTVATDLRRFLDANGFETVELLLVYWNMTGIPNAMFEDADAAAFQAAAAVYMQDAPIDRAILFRVDPGTDLHYKIRDPAGIFDADGRENARTASFQLVGKTLAATQRLHAQGNDENGFAVLAGRANGGDVVRILIANYAIPDAYLTARDRNVFEFKVPIDSIKTDMSFSVPARRTHAHSSSWTGYSVDVINLPWGDGPYEAVRLRADGTHRGEIVGRTTGNGGTASIRGDLAAPAVELIEIRPILK